ncbi:hypothetical protein PUN28_016602 [Cardiocondyla obscurior]|uniref:Uncharacterized protein n=2 Tax=Cardiocondyla obscurior TaxID=286306 RepID=A0AAW2EPZ3_9HYME
MNTLLALILIAGCAAAGPVSDVSAEPSNNLNCLEREDEFFSCICVKAINALDRAARSSDINVIDGVTFVRDTPLERIGKSLKTNEEEIMNELPRDYSDRAIKLLNMLYDSTTSFMKSHSLRLSMPEGVTAREGRAKIKKMILPLIAAAGIKIFALVPILLGSLGVLALKALFFGKIALIVAGVMAFQRLFGSGSGVGGIFNKNPAPIWYDNGAAGSWAANAGSGLQQQGYRSLNNKVDAHDLAYSAYAPVAGESN